MAEIMEARETIDDAETPSEVEALFEENQGKQDDATSEYKPFITLYSRQNIGGYKRSRGPHWRKRLGFCQSSSDTTEVFARNPTGGKEVARQSYLICGH